MSRSPAILSLCLSQCLLLAHAFGQPSSPSATMPAQQVDAAIAQLSSDNWREREEAFNRLVQLGADSQPVLTRLRRETRDEDLRSRLDAAIRKIEQNQRFGATAVSLHVKEMPAGRAFEELARQAGVTLRFPRGGLWGGAAEPKISLDADRQPFWIVMRQLCERAGVTPLIEPQRQGIRLNPGPWLARPSCAAGPLFIIAGNATRACSIDLAEPNAPERSSGLELEIIADPKLRILQYSPMVQIEEAIDDKGNTLAQEGVAPDALAANQLGDPLRWSSYVQLNDAAVPAHRLARLRGALQIVIPSRSETLQIPQILTVRNVTRSIGGHRFTIAETKQSRQGYSVAITLHRDGMGPQEWRELIQSGLVRQSVRLVDAEGRSLAAQGIGNPRGIDPTKNEVGLTLAFARGRSASGGYEAGEPDKLVFEVATEVKALLVHFELKDIVLP